MECVFTVYLLSTDERLLQYLMRLSYYSRGLDIRGDNIDSEDSGSGKSLKLLEDSDGICLARASDDCRTFWLSELITFLTLIVFSVPNILSSV